MMYRGIIIVTPALRAAQAALAESERALAAIEDRCTASFLALTPLLEADGVLPPTAALRSGPLSRDVSKAVDNHEALAELHALAQADWGDRQTAVDAAAADARAA
jgi:hypothetical protein